MYLLTASEMREADRKTIEEFGIPGRVLMENAGREAARAFLDFFRHFTDGKKKDVEVGIAAGRGNNGGDGFVIARYLRGAGMQTTVFLLSDHHRLSGDAAANFNLLSSLDIPVIEIPDMAAFETHQKDLLRPSLWVDAIFGTGLNSDIRGHYRHFIEFINNSGHPVFSVDIPSGLHADTGRPLGTCIRAEATATFGCAKPGLVSAPGCAYAGKLRIIDIGIPEHIISGINPGHRLSIAENLRKEIHDRPVDIHKGKTGHLLVLAGSKGKSGAGILAAEAALRAGAGLVSLAVPEPISIMVEGLAPEPMTISLPATPEGELAESASESILDSLTGKACLAVGPGLGTSADTGRMLYRLVEQVEIPVIADADALNLIAMNPGVLEKKKSEMVLTPHPGEMARLAGTTVADIQSDRIGHARRFAETYRVCIVLKGARTVIAPPKGPVFINPTGNPGMAGAGMGDALTGIISGLIAQGYDTVKAARLGVYLHGLAADILMAESGIGYLASDVIRTLPAALFRLKNGKVSDSFQSVFYRDFPNEY